MESLTTADLASIGTHLIFKFFFKWYNLYSNGSFEGGGRGCISKSKIKTSGNHLVNLHKTVCQSYTSSKKKKFLTVYIRSKRKTNKTRKKRKQSICAVSQWKIILRIIFKVKTIFFRWCCCCCCCLINIYRTIAIAWEFCEFIYGAIATLIQQAALFFVFIIINSLSYIAFVCCVFA